MKTAFTILLIVIAVIACGCTAAAPATAPATAPAAAPEAAMAPAPAPAIPDLVGNWTGPMQGYDQGTGFTDYAGFGVTMTITEQKGRIFAGEIVFEANGTVSRSEIAGAIGSDNRTLFITEELGGYSTGTVTGADTLELIYMEDGSPYSIAIDTFSRA